MNDFKELYDSILNPIEDPLAWESITNAYSRSFSLEDFKNNVSKLSNKNDRFVIDENDRKEFFYTLYDKWVTYLLSLSQDKVNILISENLFELDFKELLFILKNNKATNFDELKAMLEHELVKKYFSKIVSWNKLENITVNSYYDRIPSKLDYMLSLNVYSQHLYKVALMFIEKCGIEGLPYYIQLSEVNDKDNTINIYVDNVRIKKYISIINQLRKENASLIGRLNHPVLMGVTKGFIGICSANINDSTDYNAKRSRILFNSLDAVLCEYASKNLDKQIHYKSLKISLREFICMFIADGEIDRLVQEKNDDISYYARNYSEINELKDYIQKQLLLNIDLVVTKDLREYKDKDVLKIPMTNNKYISVLIPSFTCAIRKLIPVLMFIDEELTSTLRERIRNECIYEDIDTNKICFNQETAMIINNSSEEKKEIKDIEKMVKLMNDTKKLRQKKELEPEEKKLLTKSIKEIISIIDKNNKDK